MIKTFCDVCKEEIKTDNPGRFGHRVDSGDLAIIINVRKNDKLDDCDLCLDCLLEMINTKPKKQRSDKGKSHKQASKRSDGPTEKPEANNDGGPDVIIITPADGETDYVVRIKDVETAGPSLRLAVLGTLEEWGGVIPADLSQEGREQLERVLKAKEA